MAKNKPESDKANRPESKVRTSRPEAPSNEQDFLKQYRVEDFPRPSVATDMVIFTVGDTLKDNYRKLPGKELRVLLIRRGVHPFMDQWALPGGFLRPGETVGECARRELREESGLDSAYLEQLFTFSDPERDPRAWVISCAHLALVDDHGLSLTAGDDARDARWFKLSYELLEESRTASARGSHRRKICRLGLSQGETLLSAIIEESSGGPGVEFELLKNRGLAFDHARIIACAVHRLRNKLEYTDLALNLMPEKFTLTELQQVYEVILDRPLLKAAFRRKIKNLVRETENYAERSGHRPSRLFRRNWESGVDME